MSPPFFLAVRHENPWYNSKKRRRKGMTDRNVEIIYDKENNPVVIIKDKTLEGSSYDGSKHVCDNPPSIGKRSMGEYRTSAWVCSGGCGVMIYHNSDDGTYSYYVDLYDRRGEVYSVRLGTPSQTVLNSLKYETIWE